MNATGVALNSSSSVRWIITIYGDASPRRGFRTHTVRTGGHSSRGAVAPLPRISDSAALGVGCHVRKRAGARWALTRYVGHGGDERPIGSVLIGQQNRCVRWHLFSLPFFLRAHEYRRRRGFGGLRQRPHIQPARDDRQQQAEDEQPHRPRNADRLRAVLRLLNVHLPHDVQIVVQRNQAGEYGDADGHEESRSGRRHNRE